MILVTSVFVGLLVGFVSGGSLAAFKTLRLRWLPLLFATVFMQIVIFTPIAGRYHIIQDYGSYIHIATLLVTLLVMSRNLHIPGMKIIMVGAALNVLVIAANGGYMPSPAARLAEAGRLNVVTASESGKDDATLSNSKIAADGTPLLWDNDTPLLILGDIFAVPRGWPLANVFSLGDVLIGLGAGVAIVRVMRTRREDEPAPELREASEPTG